MSLRIHDISGWIYGGMWSYCPEYPGAEISELPHPAFLPPDCPVYLQKFVLGGQTGTYIETRAHVDRSADPVTALPLVEFLLPAVVIHVGPKGANQPVTVKNLERAEPDLRPGDAALLCTGWDRKWDDPDFVEGSPYISREAALWLMERGIGILGADFPRFDYPAATQFPWAEFWRNVNLLLAPLANLEALDGRCGQLIALPLKIREACATPCRAAIILDE
ncbi:MAG: cyclase family protein [Armatimonadota bacterium]